MGMPRTAWFIAGGLILAGDPGPTRAQNQGGFPALLVGVWQQTISSADVYTNTVTGERFRLGSGFSAKLILQADGRYSLQHYTQGVSSNCAHVSYLDDSSGTATVQNDRLILRPSQRTLTIVNCTSPGKRNLPNNPLVFNASLEYYETLIQEVTLKMELKGGPFPLSLKLLQLDPALELEPPSQPEGFQLGQDLPYRELQGLWADASDSDTGFYNPKTGAFYIPTYNARENRWLRFVPGGYELAKVFENASLEGVCKKDLIYYEKGSAHFQVLNVNNDTYEGDVRFQASEARLIVNIRGEGCGGFAGTRRYNLRPQTAYYKFGFTESVGFSWVVSGLGIGGSSRSASTVRAGIATANGSRGGPECAL